MEPLQQLRKQARLWGVSLGEHQLSLFDRYASLLADYELANVIGTRNRTEIISEHLLDSLSCFLIPDLGASKSLVDVGTGAGLPGIPLGIARPDLHVALVESRQKKTTFLEYVREELDLGNTTLLHARAEELGSEPLHRETYDIATARALAALPTVLEYCAPLLTNNGLIVAMKGKLPSEELTAGVRAGAQLGLELRAVHEVLHSDASRQKQRKLVVFNKVRRTPKRYPRKAGEAKKRPLGP